jgi:exosortase A-associated hydrolase 2
MTAQSFFLATPGGQRFCLFHPAQGVVPRGRVLYIHPFAEEMNKSRRMAALQSHALAQAGFAVLQLDLGGCGDSAGDFGDARWDDWIADVRHASIWLNTQTAVRCTPLWLWGLRAGCLLSLQAAQHLDEVCNFLFWQPPWSGKALLQQFLRLRLAADMLHGTGKGAMEGMRQQLHRGLPVEVAGYLLSADVAQGLEQAALSAPTPSVPARRVEWFEVSALQHPRITPLPAGARALWHRPGIALVRHALHGPAFWQSAEIEELPELLTATTAALCKEPA